MRLAIPAARAAIKAEDLDAMELRDDDEAREFGKIRDCQSSQSAVPALPG
jgi:hypothetical protein